MLYYIVSPVFYKINDNVDGVVVVGVVAVVVVVAAAAAALILCS